jgi:hypothetical protein
MKSKEVQKEKQQGYVLAFAALFRFGCRVSSG